MGIVDQETENFLREIQPLFEGTLGEIQRECLQEGIPMIPPETARLLAVLIGMQKPQKILEVGCAVGFSAGLMCRCMGESGRVVTIDRFEIMIDQARKNFKRMGVENRVQLIEGHAEEVLPLLTGKYDMIFLDAAKGQYSQYLPRCLELLEVGGLLIADDVLQEGRVARDRLAAPRRQRTMHTRLRQFLYDISHMPELESCIVPIGDGLAVCRKIAEKE